VQEYIQIIDLFPVSNLRHLHHDQNCGVNQAVQSNFGPVQGEINEALPRKRQKRHLKFCTEHLQTKKARNLNALPSVAYELFLPRSRRQLYRRPFIFGVPRRGSELHAQLKGDHARRVIAA